MSINNKTDGSLPGSSVCEISQAKILEWVDISFSRGSSLPRELPDPGIKFDPPALVGRLPLSHLGIEEGREKANIPHLKELMLWI